MERTYFQVDGVDPVVLTTQGTRPGDPVGDAFFNLAMAVIMKQVTERIADNTDATWEGCAATVDSFASSSAPSAFAWFEIAFVDDCAIAMRAPCNDQLETLASVAIVAVRNEAYKRRLLLNFEVGKTEFMVHWRGTGTRAFKEKVAQNSNAIHIAVGGETLALHCTLSLVTKQCGSHSRC